MCIADCEESIEGESCNYALLINAEIAGLDLTKFQSFSLR